MMLCSMANSLFVRQMHQVGDMILRFALKGCGFGECNQVTTPKSLRCKAFPPDTDMA